MSLEPLFPCLPPPSPSLTLTLVCVSAEVVGKPVGLVGLFLPICSLGMRSLFENMIDKNEKKKEKKI